jgi:hypothetical protein
MSAFKSKLSALSGAVALTLLAGTATAGQIALTYQGPSVPAEGGRQTATITVDGIDEINDSPVQVFSYGFNMRDEGGTLGSFLAWCLDVGSFLSTSATVARPYIITETPFSNSFGLDTTQRARVQSVFDANFGDLDATNGVEAAGFQLALWDAVYDGDWDVQGVGGVFSASASDDVIAKANFYLVAARDYNGGQAFAMTFLESSPALGQTKYQNLVTVSPVPIPAAGGMLLLALGGLGLAARRRRKAA